jgi:hypothetical protein
MAQPAPSAFIDAQRYGSLLVVCRITPYVNGTALGSVLYGSVSTGTFTQDRSSNQRWSGQLTIEMVPTVPPPAILPVKPGSLLAPFGNEVFVETGIAGGQTASVNGKIDLTKVDWVPNGLFAIATSTVDDTSLDLTCTLDLYDRSWTIAQRALKFPYNVPATESANTVDEIVALLNMIWAEDPKMAPLQYNILPTDATVPVASYPQGSDPWQAALDMAQAAGYELYFDRNGVCVGKPIPNPFTQPIVWNFTDQETDIAGYAGTGSTALGGSPFSTPAEVQIVMTRDAIVNDVIIEGTGYANMATYNGNGIETTPPPMLAEAYDNNPQSPTFIGGGMGDVPTFVQSALVTSGGAQAYANNQLQIALSSSWTVTISIPPMGILDVDDVVSITRPRVGLWRTAMILDTLTQVISYADLEQITGRVLAEPFYTPS